MSGINGFGSALSRGNGATPEVFTAIGNVTNIGAPKLSRDTIDTTAHDSADGWREFVAGLKDAGEVSADVNYDPVKHDLLVDDLDDDQPVSYKLTFPDGTVWAFEALLTGFEASAPMDDKLAASLTWKVSGKPVITPGA